MTKRFVGMRSVSSNVLRCGLAAVAMLATGAAVAAHAQTASPFDVANYTAPQATLLAGSDAGADGQAEADDPHFAVADAAVESKAHEKTRGREATKEADPLPPFRPLTDF
ncbi:MAG TPA: hypothetical protein VEI03_16015 [Stellaceae bacterium]|nr:hypothetical protein [Stellaceae bacterium]